MSVSRLLASLALLAFLFAPAAAKDLPEIKALYVGDARAKVFADFLQGKVAAIETRSIQNFDPADAAAFDVVLLDWPQNQENRNLRKHGSPLGARDQWGKPTVLLGSAGLNLAVAWKLKGGSGCTCMDPLAYDLRSHELFARPFEIDRGKMISIPTPEDFRRKIKDEQIRVLPLVDDLRAPRNAGWCTYADEFASLPDCEVFCGGVNHKTPTAAGLWRQGNLLHFGFEESPAELNETGRNLLLNSIAYISRFMEDRPIAVTPSVFAGPVAYDRATIVRWLQNSSYPTDAAKDLLAPKLWEQLADLPNREKMAARAAELAPFLHPDGNQQLEVDEDLQALGVGFDDPKFFEQAIEALRSSDQAAVARARRLLERYMPDGPKSTDANGWSGWWTENRPYLFASDDGDYRWYVDPLARRRGIPQAELRGSRRADLPVQVTGAQAGR